MYIWLYVIMNVCVCTGIAGGFSGRKACCESMYSLVVNDVYVCTDRVLTQSSSLNHGD